MFTLKEVSEWDVGANVGDLAQDIVRTARDAYCEVYRTDPLSVRNFFVSNPVGDAIEGINNELCKRIPLPDEGSSQVPLNSGQCPVLYRVENRWTGNFDPGFGNPLSPISGTAGSNLLGPLVSVSTSVIDSGVQNNPFQSEILVTSASGASQVLRSQPSSTRPTAKFNLVRLDGGEDSCGPPPPPPTPDPIPDPQPIVRYKPVPLPGPGGGVYVVPVILKPVITLAPRINIQVGPFNVSFGLPDVTINNNFAFNPEFNAPSINLPPGIDQPPKLPPSGCDPCEGAGGGDCPDVDLTPVIERLDIIRDEQLEQSEQLDRIEDCACEPEVDASTVILGSGNSFKATLPEYTIRVRIVSNQTPSSVRDQGGGGVAPDVYFVGWYAFGRAEFWSDRKPCSYIQNSFPVPEGYTQIAVTLKGGATGTLIADVETPQEE